MDCAIYLTISSSVFIKNIVVMLGKNLGSTENCGGE